MTFHQTIIIGNIGNDPELKALPSGTMVCNLSVAVNETWNDRQSGEKREKTTWYRVATFGNTAENVAKYLSKGRQVMVTGTVEARGYMNNAGEAAASLELRARDVKFLQGGNGSGQSTTPAAESESDDDLAALSDIPF